jgi:hypothetical protein
MAQNKLINIQPIALSTTLGTNLINCAITSTTGSVGLGTLPQPYLIIRHIRILNKTAAAATFSLWKGASLANAAGTEVIGTGYSVAANSAFDWYGILRLDSTDFLVGGSGTTLSLVLSAEGEIGFSG